MKLVDIISRTPNPIRFHCNIVVRERVDVLKNDLNNLKLFLEPEYVDKSKEDEILSTVNRINANLYNQPDIQVPFSNRNLQIKYRSLRSRVIYNIEKIKGMYDVFRELE